MSQLNIVSSFRTAEAITHVAKSYAFMIPYFVLCYKNIDFLNSFDLLLSFSGLVNTELFFVFLFFRSSVGIVCRKCVELEQVEMVIEHVMNLEIIKMKTFDFRKVNI